MVDVRKEKYPISNTQYPRMKERPCDPEDRWVDDAVRIIRRCEALPETKVGRRVATQMELILQETKEWIAMLFSSRTTAEERDGLGQPGYLIFIRTVFQDTVVTKIKLATCEERDKHSNLDIGHWVLDIGYLSVLCSKIPLLQHETGYVQKT